jgi:hypothetical protein
MALNNELLCTSDRTINDLLKAAYPLIYVLSWEEERVERGLLQIATERGRKFPELVDNRGNHRNSPR